MIDLERYAEIAAALANADDRAVALVAAGVTEEEWEAIDDAWQARLSEALDAYNDDGVPELVAAFSEAYNRAKERYAAEPMPFAKFIELTRAVQRSQDIPRTLTSFGVTFSVYSRANMYWTVRMAKDPVLGEQLRRALE